MLAAYGSQINTAFVECLNLGICQHVVAIGWRVTTLCKGEDGLRHQLALYRAYYKRIGISKGISAGPRERALRSTSAPPACDTPPGLCTHAPSAGRRDGRLQMSPVIVGLDAPGRAIIASRETTYKVRHLRRDPRAALCVFVEAFTGPWVQIEGTAEVVTLPEAMEPLVDYYRRWPANIRIGRTIAGR